MVCEKDWKPLVCINYYKKSVSSHFHVQDVCDINIYSIYMIIMTYTHVDSVDNTH